MAAARQCSLHSTGCSLHFTQQWRKGSKRFQQHIPRANQPDGSCNESKVRRLNRRSLTQWEDMNFVLNLSYVVPQWASSAIFVPIVWYVISQAQLSCRSSIATRRLLRRY